MKRKNNVHILTVVLILATFLMVGIYPPKTGKQAAMELYEQYYKVSQVNSISWNGDVKKCDAGNLKPDILKKAEMRINYFRLSCGLKPISLDDNFNDMAQEAALIMTANNQLSHTPPKNWKCYSEKGFEGAKNSNLGHSDFANFPATSFVTGFILDYGAPNFNIGHRKWLLNSRSVKMGYGNTGNFEAIYVTGLQQEPLENAPEYYAYPPEGYFPYKLIFEKWSFSIPYGNEVDFSKARIEMKDSSGEKIKVKTLSTSDPWYYDPTIVWQAESLFTEEEIKYIKNSLKEKGYIDKSLHVSISNVKVNDEMKIYSYEVIPFDPEE